MSPSMNTDVRLEELLRRNQYLDESALSLALDRSQAHQEPLADTIVALGLCTYRRIGAILSELHGLPYRPLLDATPPAEAKRLVPLATARDWRIFPVECDTSRNALLLATDDPSRREIHEFLGTWVLTPYRISLAVACREEIERAIDIFYCGAPWVPSATLSLPSDFTILSHETAEGPIAIDEIDVHGRDRILVLDSNLPRGRAVRSVLLSEGYPDAFLITSPQEAAQLLDKHSFAYMLISSRAFPQGGGWQKFLSHVPNRPPTVYYQGLAPLLLGQESTYKEMRQSVLRLVVEALRDHYGEGTEAFKSSMARARYSHLLGLRLGLPVFTVDRITLAAQLADPDLPAHLRESIDTPYEVRRILTELEGDQQPPASLEAHVVWVIGWFLHTRAEQTEPQTDAEGIRGLFAGETPSAQSHRVIESLIGLLRDEETLSGLDVPSQRALIADPQMQPDSPLVLRLRNDGIEATIVADADAAIAFLSTQYVSLVLCETDLGRFSGAEFCRALRNDARTAQLPIVFHSNDRSKRVMTECLQAGADDFLDKSNDPEVVSLKLRRLLARRQPTAGAGIKGSLSDMSFIDVVQILSSGSKSVRIKLTNENRVAEIYLSQGEVVHACLGDVEGEDAFYQAMQWTTGNFEITRLETLPRQTISLPVMGLLMEGARLEDERRRN